jgi:hypothetical protein
MKRIVDILPASPGWYGAADTGIAIIGVGNLGSVPARAPATPRLASQAAPFRGEVLR